MSAFDPITDWEELKNKIPPVRFVFCYRLLNVTRSFLSLDGQSHAERCGLVSEISEFQVCSGRNIAPLVAPDLPATPVHQVPDGGNDAGPEQL